MRLKNNIKDLFEVNDLGEKWKKLEPLLRAGIYCKIKNSKKPILIGESKIGGLPDLPKNQIWFTSQEKPLSFLAQINFEEVKKFDIENKLPEKGIIYFFYNAEKETEGYLLSDKDEFKVFYFDGDIDQLERTKAPNNLDEEFIFNEAKLGFKNELDLPDCRYQELDSIFKTSEEQDAYCEIQNELGYEYDAFHKLLGHSDNIQNPMEIECERIVNGEMDYNDPNQIKKSKKWILLFQLDSDEDLDFMWGDGGRIYFWIKEKDLKAKKFEKVWMQSQCH